jgi:CDP-paratose synthetase
MPKKILLTGATGFLGSHLLRAFIAKGWDVSIVKRSFSDTIRIYDLLPQLSFVDTDVEPLVSVFDKKKRFDAVVHTATCYGRDGQSAAEVMETNVGLPLELLENSIRCKVPVFINTATFFNSASLLYPYLSNYILSKRQFEEWGKLFSAHKKIGFLNLRLHQIYGADDDSSKFATWIFESLKKNLPHIELTPGDQKRDFVYIDDVVSAFVHILDTQKIENEYLDYDIGSGKEISIREFVEKVKEISGAKTKLIFGAKPYQNFELMQARADIGPMKNTGWAPATSLETGIQKSLY